MTLSSQEIESPVNPGRFNQKRRIAAYRPLGGHRLYFWRHGEADPAAPGWFHPCPSNALSDRYRSKTRQYDKQVRTVCTYCGVGCNLEVKVKNNHVVAISGAENAAANRGHTCLKGRYAFEFVHSPERLRTPLMRQNGKLQECSWEQAMNTIAVRFSTMTPEYKVVAVNIRPFRPGEDTPAVVTNAAACPAP